LAVNRQRINKVVKNLRIDDVIREEEEEKEYWLILS
jgi:hypothetical protein